MQRTFFSLHTFRVQHSSVQHSVSARRRRCLTVERKKKSVSLGNLDTISRVSLDRPAVISGLPLHLACSAVVYSKCTTKALTLRSSLSERSRRQLLLGHTRPAGYSSPFRFHLPLPPAHICNPNCSCCVCRCCHRRSSDPSFQFASLSRTASPPPFHRPSVLLRHRSPSQPIHPLAAHPTLTPAACLPSPRSVHPLLLLPP